jgi:hypothetical protein
LGLSFFHILFFTLPTVTVDDVLFRFHVMSCNVLDACVLMSGVGRLA